MCVKGLLERAVYRLLVMLFETVENLLSINMAKCAHMSDPFAFAFYSVRLIEE